jgi:membrane-associated phospholipid phosphatase
MPRVMCSGICALFAITRLAAQAPQREPAALHWWEGAAALGGIAAVGLLDQPLQRYIQTHRSASADALAADVRHMGQVEVFGSIPAGMAIVGLAAHRPGLVRGSLRVAASLVLAGATTTAGKLTVGRLRPSSERDADDFKPFSGHDSFPSGHTTMAFALAASLANEIRRPWATVGLFTVAAGTGWSRLNDNQHWLSDVVAGAVVGVTSAELVDGRWRIFHLSPPTLLAEPSGVGIGWRFTL